MQEGLSGVDSGVFFWGLEVKSDDSTMELHAARNTAPSPLSPDVLVQDLWFRFDRVADAVDTVPHSAFSQDHHQAQFNGLLHGQCSSCMGEFCR